MTDKAITDEEKTTAFKKFWIGFNDGTDQQICYGGFLAGASYAQAETTRRYEAELRRLSAVNAELLGALKELYEGYCNAMSSEFDFPGRPWTPERDNDTAALNARAAIQKAEEA